MESTYQKKQTHRDARKRWIPEPRSASSVNTTTGVLGVVVTGRSRNQWLDEKEEDERRQVDEPRLRLVDL